MNLPELDFYKNCYKLRLQSLENPKVCRKDIFLSLKKLFDADDLNEICVITQGSNNFTWLIKIRSEKTFQKYIYKEIELLEQIVILDSAQDYLLEYRILWLPPGITEKCVASYVVNIFNINSTDIVYIGDEKCFDYDMRHISSGIWKVKFKIDTSGRDPNLFTGGIKTFDNVKSLFIKKGEKQKCFFCKQNGHKRSMCQQFALFSSNNDEHDDESSSIKDTVSDLIDNKHINNEDKTLVNIEIAPQERQLSAQASDDDYEDTISSLRSQSKQADLCKESEWNTIIDDVNKDLAEASAIAATSQPLGLIDLILKVL